MSDISFDIEANLQKNVKIGNTRRPKEHNFGENFDNWTCPVFLHFSKILCEYMHRDATRHHQRASNTSRKG